MSAVSDAMQFVSYVDEFTSVQPEVRLAIADAFVGFVDEWCGLSEAELHRLRMSLRYR